MRTCLSFKMNTINLVPEIKTLNTFYHILEMQPGNLIKYVEDENTAGM